MKGIYILIISIDKDVTVDVGSLGRIYFVKGLYAYVGSSQKNLEKRLERHFRRIKRKFWHIDYLLDSESVKVMETFYNEAKKFEECMVAKKLSKKGSPIADFGCSDCSCVSHLFRFANYDSLRTIALNAHFRQFLLRQ